jgi:hypothetical protein
MNEQFIVPHVRMAIRVRHVKFVVCLLGAARIPDQERTRSELSML